MMSACNTTSINFMFHVSFLPVQFTTQNNLHFVRFISNAKCWHFILFYRAQVLPCFSLVIFFFLLYSSSFSFFSCFVFFLPSHEKVNRRIVEITSKIKIDFFPPSAQTKVNLNGNLNVYVCAPSMWWRKDGT